MKFEIIIPTYKRVAKLEKLLNSIEGTIGNRIDDVKVFVKFDNNDIQSFRDFTKDGKNRVINVNYGVNENRQMAFGVWNNHLQYVFKSDALIVLSDDVEFVGKGLKYAIEDFETHCGDTDWVMALNQKNPGHCASFVVIGQKFADRFPNRTCFYPGYKVCGGDNELWQFARSIKRSYLNTDEVVIIHNHIRDQTDIEGKNAFLIHDKELYKKRQSEKLLWGKDWE